MEKVTHDLLNVVHNTWPIILLTVIITVVLRITYLIKNKVRFDFYKEFLMLSFIVYILCLFQIVTGNDVPGEHGINITILKEITRYTFGSHLFYRNVVGNIVMFIPFGFFTTYFLDIHKKRYNLLVTFFTSLAIELIQLKIGRAFDVDDLILNCLGSLIGFFAYRFITYLCRNKSDRFKGNITVLLILLMVILLMTILIIGDIWK